MDNSTQILFERWFYCENLGTQLVPVIKELRYLSFCLRHFFCTSDYRQKSFCFETEADVVIGSRRFMASEQRRTGRPDPSEFSHEITNSDILKSFFLSQEKDKCCHIVTDTPGLSSSDLKVHTNHTGLKHETSKQNHKILHKALVIKKKKKTSPDSPTLLLSLCSV